MSETPESSDLISIDRSLVRLVNEVRGLREQMKRIDPDRAASRRHFDRPAHRGVRNALAAHAAANRVWAAEERP